MVTVSASRQVAYWKPKLQRNVERDRLNISKLRRGGWKVMLVWECEAAKPDTVRKLLTRFLGEPCLKN